ncbi:hypothetical protein AVEN_48830-1 [Araneus ventricosus]|uniref:Uncharacterized protein n=1 Tax=Araneus ventricosus TaxID=182803 RepID=A0A4Y2AHW5_ARAVE|nr:hypothetical protein AVEN_48830-1 [Araneus ventricosus]
MVGKTERLLYSFQGGTSGLATRNRPCNQRPSPVSHNSSGQSGKCPGGTWPRSSNTTAREIYKSLITNKHIHISWLKAHMGYDGNEEAYRLAKEAAESDSHTLSAKAPISFLKSNFKKKITEDWQSDWKDEDTGGPHLTSFQEFQLNHLLEKGSNNGNG